MRLLDTFRERRPFPGQDPWVVPHAGSLLLVQAAGGNRRIVVKRFKELARMDRNTETVIWAPSGPSSHGRHVWAPELHQIDGRWYVYFAASDGRATNHRMYALVADDPLGPYEELGPVRDPDHDVWAIDLTVFTHEDRRYAVWSGWEGPDDGFPQNLYIAPMSNPWTISGPRRCLSRPQHGWEMSVAPVNEGPEVIRHAGRLFVVYAADASWTQAYKMGLLECTGGDVMDPTSWQKLPRPFFTGGGHGCVVDTPAGTYLVYHRKLGGDPGWADREIRSAPLDWDADGYPVVRLGGPSGGTSPARGTGSSPGLSAGGSSDGLGRVA
ncbi:MAG: GH43_26 / GH43 / GH43_27 / GH43_30 / GH43_ 31 / GH43_17 / GH43_33 [uncultured Acidimicrobiales bacterium]|uniref:GH43_26 / GH43 / GH43_27 / GH43_30 / GH43_ 31 / GH43_17 / GH43_33 n=1 Tax=uncultured Acidimicrobiales bacterium TaxID=310071 RepID=A0A6J4J9X2_9ACTN|nr:MAG: GH43_26 / GH43 / GH43_27 / GH43_30 / GH43_ 31 / GH43_17 / GH43_33 [uncultured Acidimicrobiales bacterium]